MYEQHGKKLTFRYNIYNKIRKHIIILKLHLHIVFNGAANTNEFILHPTTYCQVLKECHTFIFKHI